MKAWSAKAASDIVAVGVQLLRQRMRLFVGMLRAGLVTAEVRKTPNPYIGLMLHHHQQAHIAYVQHRKDFEPKVCQHPLLQLLSSIRCCSSSGTALQVTHVS
jgi:hypothetical protein